MKQCEYSKYLSDYLDRQLHTKQETLVEEHLPLCHSCKCEWEELKELKRMLNGLSEEELPDGLHSRIISRLQNKDKVNRKLAWTRRLAIPLAAAFLIFLIGKGIPGMINNTGVDNHESTTPESTIMNYPESDDDSNSLNSTVDITTNDFPAEDGRRTRGNQELSSDQTDGIDESNNERKSDTVFYDYDAEPTQIVQEQKESFQAGSLKPKVPSYVKYGLGVVGALTILLTAMHIWKRNR